MKKEFVEAERKRELQSAFNQLDTNSDGWLTENELACYMKKIFNCSEEEVHDMFEWADTNNDGRISYQGGHLYQLN